MLKSKSFERSRALCVIVVLAMMVGLVLASLGVHTVYAEEEDHYLTLTAKGGSVEITFKYYSGTNVQYSLNGGSWTDCKVAGDTTGDTFALAENEYIQLKGKDVTTTEKYHFSMSGSGTVEASGDVTSLTNGVGGDVALTTAVCYCNMFDGCDILTKAPGLPSTTLVKSCYQSMFKQCTGLMVAPNLPATVLIKYCYQSMFSGCTSLAAPTDISHVSTLADNCCNSMYSGCTNLKVYSTNTTDGYKAEWTAPNTTSTNWSTNMFSGTGGDFTDDPEQGKTYYVKSYTLTYYQNTTETVTNMPSPKTDCAYNVAFALSSTEPICENYTFGGWNTQDDGKGTTYAAGATFTITEDTTLYAVWLDSSYAGTITITMDPAFEYGKGTTLANIKNAVNITESGLSVDNVLVLSALTGDIIDSIDAPGAYIVAIGVNAPAEKYFEVNAFYDSEADEYTYYYANNVKIDGADQMCIVCASVDYATGANSYDSTDVSNNTKALVIYSVVVSGYTLSYEMNAGSETVSNMPEEESKFKDETVTVSAKEPSRAGYTFCGWNTKTDNSGTSYNAGDTFAITEDICLYAVWAESSHEHGTVGEEGYLLFDKLLSNTFKGGILASGNYYLSGNITMTSQIIIANDATVNICLNGYVLNLGGKNIYNNGTLTIYDCGETIHRFTPNADGLWVLDEASGTKTITGGVITGGSAGKGGAIYNIGTLTINGGSFVGNKTTDATAGCGGAIYVYGGTFEMTGGTISGNTAVYAAGVCANSTTKLLGGCITDNAITATTGVYGTDFCGAGVYPCASGVLTVGGDVKIQNNTTNGKADNIYLKSGFTFAISSDTALKSGAYISVKLADNIGTFVTDADNNTDLATYFHADDTNYTLKARALGTTPETYSYSLEASLVYDADTTESVTGMPTDSKTYLKDEQVTVSTATPTRKGYNFLGWNTDKNATTAETFAGGKLTMGTGNVTLYAIWEENSYNGTISITIDSTLKYGKGTTPNDILTAMSITEEGFSIDGILLKDKTAGQYVSTVTKPGAYTITIFIKTTDGKWFPADALDANRYTGSATVNGATDYVSIGSVGESVDYTTGAITYNDEVIYDNTMVAIMYELTIDLWEIDIDESAVTEKDYDGQVASYEIDGNDKDAGSFKVEYKLHTEADSFYTETAPINAGSYDIRISRAEDEVYKSYSKIIETGLIINKAEVNEPNVSGTYVYTGKSQTVVLIGVESYMTTSDSLAQTDTGSYNITYTLDDNHAWADGSDGKVTWEIAKAKATITVDTQDITKTYGETVVLPTATSTFGTVVCDKTASDLTNAGTYTVTYSVATTDNYDGDTKTVKVTIEKIKVSEPIISGTYVYTGKSQTVVLTGVESYMTTSDTLAQTNAGKYEISYTLDDNYAWADGSDGKVTWEITKAKATITVDTQDITKTYGETVVLPTATSTFGTVVCDKTASDLTNAGTYTVTYSVAATDNYDGDTKTVKVTIEKIKVSEPIISGTYVYTGKSQTVVLTGVESYMTTSDSLAQTDAGSYNITYTLDDNHAWADGSDGKVTWEIKPVEIKSQTNEENGKPTVEVETEDGFSSDITVEVEVTVEADVDSKEMIVDYYNLNQENIKLEKNEKIGIVFEIKLIQTIDGVAHEIQPSDIKEGTTIKVKMLIPDDVDISKVTRILHVHSADDIEELLFDASKVVDGYYELEINRLSEFAFVYEESGSASVIILFVGGFVLILLAGVFFVWNRKQKTKTH